MKNSVIFQNAHAMTRRTISQFPGANYRVTFAAALRLAYQEAEFETAADLWNDYQTRPADLYAYLLGMAGKAYKQRDARAKRDGTPLPNVFTWVDPAHVADNLREVAAAAWIKAEEAIEAGKGDEETENPGAALANIISKAIIAAATQISREAYRNGNALRAVKNDDGETIREYIIDNAAPLAEPIAPGPETAALVRDAIERAAADEIDLRIIAGKAYGLTQTEIAALVNLSQRGTGKRLQRIRERYDASK